MEIVIDIPDDIYSAIVKQYRKDKELQTRDNLYKAIVNGTPLPKGHGRLIDYGYVVDAIDDWVNTEEYRYTNATEYLRKRVANTPTIIEADGGRCVMSDRQKLEKIRRTLDSLDKEMADKEVTRDYWDGFCKVFNAVEAVLNENSD